MQSETNSEPLPADITAHLDRGLQRLSRKERDAVLLRFFEERPLSEVGANLGISEDAAKKRVSRALEKLRQFLGRRGTQISSVTLAAALTQGTSKAAVSAAAISKVTAAALSPTTNSALLAQVLAAWRWAKIKMLLGAGSGAVVTAIVVSQTISKMETAQGQQTPPPDRALIAAGASNAPTAPDDATEQVPTTVSFAGQILPAHPLKITVLDATSSKPIAGAEVSASPNTDGNPKSLRTNPQGIIILAVPDHFPGDERITTFEVFVHTKDYPSRLVNWYSSTGSVFTIVTNGYTVRLESGITLSGTVASDRGEALAGIRVGLYGCGIHPHTIHTDQSGKVIDPPTLRVEDYPYYYQGTESDDAVLTDDSGRFHFEHFPSDTKALVVDLIGQDGARREFRTAQGDEALGGNDAEPISYRDLQSGSARLVLPKGITREGVVVDNNGEPVRGAKITEEAQWGSPIILSHSDTDFEGRFWLSNRAPREVILAATAAGHASASTIVDLKPGLGNIRIQLPAELPLKGRVVNQDGEPVPGANLDLDGADNEGLGLDWSGKTDGEGRFVWRGAPTNEVALSIKAAEYSSRIAHLRATTNELLVTLNDNHNNNAAYITGTVADATSGKPVEHFKVKVRHDRWTDWENGRTVEGVQGGFNLTTAQSEVDVQTQPSWFLTIQADGYEPYMTRIYAFEEGDQTLDIKLQPGGTIEGLVRNPDGGPAVGCHVNVATVAERLLSSHPGEFSLFHDRHRAVQTDATGRFKFEKPLGATAVVAFDDTGWAIANVRTNSADMELELLPWGHIEGTLMNGDTPLANQIVRLGDLVADASNPVQILQNANTDDNGYFAFDKLPASDYQISLNSRSWPYVKTMQTAVNVSAGKTNHISLKESGRTVVAKLIASQPSTAINWEDCSAVLSRDVFVPPAPTQLSFVTTASYQAAQSEYAHDPEVLAAERNVRTYRGTVSSDGSVIFENIPPGDYLLDLKLFERITAMNYDSRQLMDQLSSPVTVPPEKSESTNVVTLGTFALDGI